MGKSTQVPLLRAWLEEGGVSVATTREPGGTELGERIRELALARSGFPVPERTELLLILAARAAFVKERVEPTLAAGEWVLSDRYDLSTLAYQGHGRGIDLECVARMNRFATSGLVPDLTLILHLSDAERRARRRARREAGAGVDRIESAGSAFLRRVAQGYLELAESRPEAVIVPADGSVARVAARIRDEVARRLGPGVGPGAPAG